MLIVLDDKQYTVAEGLYMNVANSGNIVLSYFIGYVDKVGKLPFIAYFEKLRFWVLAFCWSFFLHLLWQFFFL